MTAMPGAPDSPSAEPGATAPAQNGGSVRPKLFGRAFYESIGSPKLILAPMVEQSEFAWRMLTRSFMSPSTSKNLLAYTPMFHSRMFTDTPKYRESHFQPLKTTLPSPPDAYHAAQYNNADMYLDGNPAIDRPLFVQFCSNSPEDLLQAAHHVAPFCDAVDLNLGCPQGIARRGHYGAFLQEDWDLVYKLINRLHTELAVPVTAKMRILETREKTLEYAKTILSAGASIITVHGRQRDQKGHATGLADWSVIRYLRDNLPPETVVFANGNILTYGDIEQCLQATGADGVMSAEGNLYDPSIFAEPPPVEEEGREYWRGRDGKGGYRMDAVMRRYMDIIHRYVLGQAPPERGPLFLPSDSVAAENGIENGAEHRIEDSTQNGAAAPAASNGQPSPQATQHHPKPEPETQEGPPAKKQKQKNPKPQGKQEKVTSPNLTAMQPHLFHLLRPLVSRHIPVRDALARCRAGDIPAFEHVLSLVENAVKQGLLAYEADPAAFETAQPEDGKEEVADEKFDESSVKTVARVKRPWWVCQPYVRPLPKEALAKGALSLTKKQKKRLEDEQAKDAAEAKAVGLTPGGKVETEMSAVDEKVEIPKEGLVCG
ncbi:tRNA dihydrouridine synthase [Coniosporium tulheliwenetii]|uniref:tRNA dihydrouridine synthase n=1 Tax=Coniosporium tulheliwenetii TaxID=3383036 RepID=A0ACC2YSN8_9PEZI|nr:tRNA dihydrouridine synthase [Cladosporium sp. JES 115]